MKLGEVLTLLKAGYSRAEIKEMEKEPELQPSLQPELEQEAQLIEEPKEEPTPEPDYRALYEESQRKLQEAQRSNINQNIAEDAGKLEEHLADTIRGFM